MRTLALFWCLGLLLTGCFGSVSEVARHYYTLNLEPGHAQAKARLPGLVRVRDLDPEAAYDRFQIVIRRSPFELTYRERDVWAVKPSRMISDLIARGLADQEIFSSVTRELSERRPDYLVSGELRAIEVYDSDDLWFAHIAMALQMTHVATGKILWTYTYDDRKQVPPQNFSHAVRALSELISAGVDKAIDTMDTIAPVEGTPSVSDALPPPRSNGRDNKRDETAADEQKSSSAPSGPDAEPIVVPEGSRE